MKALAPCKYYEATSIDDATSILKDYEGKAMIYAGGTDVLDLMKKRFRPTPEILVNIKKIPGLNTIEEKSDGLHIGPTVTISELAEKAPIPMLKDAAKSVSSPQLRNAGTVGGNLCLDVGTIDGLLGIVIEKVDHLVLLQEDVMHTMRLWSKRYAKLWYHQT
jgi:CO/xanthine dehydrogenase FAD-binding subunit